MKQAQATSVKHEEKDREIKELQKSVEEIEGVVENWKQKGQLQKDAECLKELRSNLCAKEYDLSELKDKLARISEESTAV